MTINGQHTLEDAQQLASAASLEISGLQRGFSALSKTKAADKAWRAKWNREFQHLQTAFAPAKMATEAKSEAYKHMPNVRPSVVPAEPEYKALVSAIAPLPNLRARLSTVGTPSAFGADPDMFPAPATVTTQSGNLNVRATPNAAGSLVGTLPKGARITITGPSVGGWYPITNGAISGYSSSAYITAIATPNNVLFDSGDSGNVQPAASVQAGTTATVTTQQTGAAGRLNVHEAPGQTGATAKQFEHGQTITITGPAVSGYYPVTGRGVSGAQISGWASAQYIAPQMGGQPVVQDVQTIPEVVVTGNVFTPAPVYQPAGPALPAFMPPSNAVSPAAAAASVANASIATKIKGLYAQNPGAVIAGGVVLASGLAAGGYVGYKKLKKHHK